MGLGARIQHHRRRLGLTQDQLADRSGVPKVNISALEVRDSDRTKFAIPLARAMGLTVEQLTNPSYEGEPDPSAAALVEKIARLKPGHRSTVMTLIDSFIESYAPAYNGENDMRDVIHLERENKDGEQKFAGAGRDPVAAQKGRR